MPEFVTVGRCGELALHSCIKNGGEDHRVEIDLRGLTFAEPLGLTAIAAFAEQHVREGRRVVVRSPLELNVSHYLARMRLDDTLTALGAEISLPRVSARDLDDVLLEVTRFDGHRGAGALAQLVHRLIARHDPDAANALHNGIVEAGINVVDHSRRRGGFIAAQITHHGRRLSFSVSDSGIGLLGSLAPRGARDDRQALDLAVEPGVSEHDDPGRGVGLSDLVQELARLGGHLHLVSGRSSLSIGSARLDSRTSPQTVTGTHLQGVIPLRRAVSLD
jgi:hypothetical protein